MKILDAGLTFSGAAPSAGVQEKIDAVVLHHRAGAGDVNSIHAQHLAQGWWGIGYHYYVRKNGEVWRGRPEKYAGSHAGASNGYNLHSIGVCFEGNFEKDTMPDAQLAAGLELLADICSRYEIVELKTHGELAATACPGKNFPLAKFRSRFSEIRAGDVQTGGTQTGGAQTGGTQTDYSADAVKWAQESGVLLGTPGGDLRLDEAATRREVLVFLYRALNAEK